MQEEDLQISIKKLMDYYHTEKESAVRVVVLALLAEIGCNFCADVESLIDEILVLIQTEESHKVRAQALSTLLRLAKSLNSKFYIQCCKKKVVLSHF